MQEDITKGQRVESLTVEALVDGEWLEVGNGTTIGYKRMVRFPQVKTDQIRITINGSRKTANISNVEAYFAEPIATNEVQAVWNNLPRDKWKLMDSAPLTIDLGKATKLNTFTYAPANGEAKPTMAFRYKLYVSDNGQDGKAVPTNGEFSNIMHNPVPQTVGLRNTRVARYVKIEATTPTGTPAILTMDEVGFMSK